MMISLHIKPLLTQGLIVTTLKYLYGTNLLVMRGSIRNRF